jgi:hypothetical protein
MPAWGIVIASLEIKEWLMLNGLILIILLASAAFAQNSDVLSIRRRGAVNATRNGCRDEMLLKTWLGS